jgi:hypothetical protein
VSPPSVKSDATVLHAKQSDNAASKVHQFVVTINLGFAVIEDKRSAINAALLLNRFMAFAKQTDANFRIEPLNGSVQSISNPSHIPTTKDAVELYYQHRIVPDEIRGENNAAMSKAMGDMKDPSTPFQKYLNQDTVYVSRALLGIFNMRISGVMLETYPQYHV